MAREQLSTQVVPDSWYGLMQAVQTVVEVQVEQLFGHLMQELLMRENPAMHEVHMV